MSNSYLEPQSRTECVHADVQFDGKTVTPEMIRQVCLGAKVRIAPEAMERVRTAHQVLLEAAYNGQMIYGLTMGVGLNKDRKMINAEGQRTPEIIDASIQFNINLLRSHSSGAGADAPVLDVRAAMAARLNGFLSGGSGVHETVVQTYVSFLNQGITPVMPSMGSIGESDISLLSHIGLAMIGEGEVVHEGKKRASAEVLKSTGITPLKPFGKDALSIFNSNAYASGMGALALADLAHLNRIYKMVYALSLQSLNGNVSPLLEDTLALRPFPWTQRAGAELRALLNGSSIWQSDASRALQDPLSFRTGAYLLGELDRTYHDASVSMAIQINSSDDNPGTAVGVKAKSDSAQEKQAYMSSKGAVFPSANFEPLPWVIPFEASQIAIAHNSIASASRIIRLNDPGFTGLSRFLGTEKTVHALGVIEKTVVTLAMENKSLAMPVSMDFLPVAGNIEDIATNAPRVVQRLRQQIDNSYALLGIELLHAAQAIDLRCQKNAAFTLSPETQTLYEALRKRVAFLDVDRSLTNDFRAAQEVLRAIR